MPFVIGFASLFALFVLYLVVQTRKAGPQQVSEVALARAITVARATAEEPGNGWSALGSRTSADGLRLRFDHDDDPQAEATFLVDPAGCAKANTLSHRMTVRLGADYESFHVHTRGHAFRVRMRGTGAVVGKEVCIMMRVRGDGTPLGGKVENDDDTDAAVGDWIDFESVEVLDVRRSGG
jgi:hypothetical protein